MERHQCQVCGHVYDPAEGDAAAGIAPGTSFENLPQDWPCPVCGSPKSMYEPCGR